VNARRPLYKFGYMATRCFLRVQPRFLKTLELLSKIRTFQLMPSIVSPINIMVQSYSLPLSARLGAIKRQTVIYLVADCLWSSAVSRWQFCATLRRHRYTPPTMTDGRPSLRGQILSFLSELFVAGKFNAVYYWLKFDTDCRSVEQYLTNPPDDLFAWYSLSRITSHVLYLISTVQRILHRRYIALAATRFGWRTFGWRIWCVAASAEPGNRIRCRRRRWRHSVILQRLLIDERLL